MRPSPRRTESAPLRPLERSPGKRRDTEEGGCAAAVASPLDPDRVDRRPSGRELGQPLERHRRPVAPTLGRVSDAPPSDGYVADLDDGVAAVFDWYVTSGDVEMHTGGAD